MTAASAALLTVFSYDHGALGRNLEGVTEEEARVRAESGANSINWLVGHILLHRQDVHRSLGLDLAWPEEWGDGGCYRQGESGEMGEGARDLSELVERLAWSQSLLIPALQSASDELLDSRFDEKRSVSERVSFLGWHEGYHVGQVGSARRSLGKSGAI